MTASKVTDAGEVVAVRVGVRVGVHVAVSVEGGDVKVIVGVYVDEGVDVTVGVKLGVKVTGVCVLVGVPEVTVGVVGLGVNVNEDANAAFDWIARFIRSS